MKVTARTMVYAGHRYKRGDTINATGESDARILSALKRAERVVEPFTVPPGKPAEEPTEEPTAAVPIVEPVSFEPAVEDDGHPVGVEAPRTKRPYRRRDMQAE